jgi:spore germination protein
MNVLTKSIIGLLCATTIAGANYGYKEHQHNRQWKQQQLRNAQYWQQTQSFYLYNFDYALAESLAAPTPAKRQAALQSAIENAKLILQLEKSASVTMNFQSWSSYESFIMDSIRYLAYPASEKGPSLNPDQLEQIQRMRKFARTALPYLDQMREKGYDTSLADIQQISTAMEASLSQLDSISTYGNKAFNEFLYNQNPYMPTKPGTVFAGEPSYTAAELTAKAKTFMGDIWNKGAGKQIVNMVSGGDSPEFGEVMDFMLSDTDGKQTSSYIATLSKSGHVLQVTRHGSISEEAAEQQPIDVTQAVVLADAWMARWSDERLTLITKEQTDTSIHLAYIPVREQVSIPQMQVEWQFDRRTGALKSFDAYKYFYNYNKSFPLHPKLTAQQASGKLGPYVNASGMPKLEIHNSKLVYAFAVTGVEGVSHVYVNALTGAGEGIDYNL